MIFLQTYALPCLWSFLACYGFALIFNIHGGGALRACLGGALGWFVYVLLGQSVWAAFFAALAIGFYAETIARLQRSPVTGYVLVALLPLVPGGGIYRAMRFALSGENEAFMTTLFETFGIAAALAVGSMLSSSLFRSVYASLLRRGRKEGRR